MAQAQIELWIAIGFIVLQAGFMTWLSNESSKAFWRMAGQIENLTALLAQRIEHESSKLGVEGSSPSERVLAIRADREK